VRFFGIPYAGPLAAREALGVAGLGDHEAVLRECSGRCASKVPAGGRSVLVAHAFVSGGDVCDSENGLTVGGTGEVSAAVLGGFNYVALGHLHRSQEVDGGRVHYSGSLLKYSASEALHRKSVKLVEMDAHGGCRVEGIAITPRRDLRRLSGRLDELVDNALRDTRRDDYIFAELTDDGPVLNPMERLQDVYPHTVEVVRASEADCPEERGSSGIVSAGEHGQLSTPELFAKFFRYATDGELPAEHAKVFERVLGAMKEKGETD
jgi:DNA repair protein SbcD/Mre11